MNKYDYYDNLKKYKKNYLQHAKSKLYGIQQDDHQYYKRIGEPGNYRYFYTKDQWDAYQKERAGMTGYEDWKKNQDAKETAKEKANMTGYDSWKKEEDAKKKAEKEAQDQKNIEINRSTGKSPTNFTDAQAQANRIGEKKEKKKQENIDKNRQADIQKQLDEAFKNKEDFDKVVDIIANTKEGKEIIDEIYNYYMSRQRTVFSNGYYDYYHNDFEDKLNNTYNLNDGPVGHLTGDVIVDKLFEKAMKKADIHLSAKHREDEIWYSQFKERQRQKYAEAERIKPITNAIDEMKHSQNDNEFFDSVYDTLTEWRKNEEKDPVTGLPLKNYELNAHDDLKLVNPGYNYEEHSATGDMTEDEVTGYHHNCLLSTIACVLRERGYDVSAGTDLNGVRTWGPSFFNEYDNIYPNVETSIGDLSSIKDLRQEMEQLPAGSYGDMQVVWDLYNENRGFRICGHSVFFKVDENSKLHIYDGQTGWEMKWEHYEEHAMMGRYYVLNDAEIDIDYIKENKMIIY